MTVFNKNVAQKLRKIASLLKAQNANYFRCQAYLHAAQTIEKLPQDLKALCQAEGIDGLTRLPTIGTGIAHLIYEYIATGSMSRLKNLQGAPDPVATFQVIPTIGRELAQRIYDTLHIDSLASLEKAVQTGQIDHIEGVGKKRRQAISNWLSKNFSGHNKQLKTFTDKVDQQNAEPSVELLLKTDAEYRNKANAGKLPLISPKQFNPENKAWLPILHTQKDGWHFTTFYSNTERAHKLNRVYDWVVICFYDSHHREGQRTVVTETHGDLIGRRVVRGQENQCRRYYQIKQ
ncbi:DNA-binding protein [Colwelliaceae bacterium 6471]